MQNPKQFLENINKQAVKNANNKNYKFRDLYKQFIKHEWYIHSYSQLYSNKGSGTPGVDGKTMDGFGKQEILRITNAFKDESYQPKPARRTYIPKKNGKKRPIGIPTMTDRYVQEIINEILTIIYEPTFSEESYGFRQGRGCHDAINAIYTTFQGTVWFIEGDIKSFFDNIDHHIMIGILRRRIDDERFIRLIWKFLRAGYVEDWKFNRTFSGTPQGGIISPILANIYLNELDGFIKDLQNKFNIGKHSDVRESPEKKKTEYIKGKMRKNIDKNRPTDSEEEFKRRVKDYKKIALEYIKSKDLSKRIYSDKENFKKLCYVRYADDFLLGVIGSKEDAENIKQQISEFVKNSLKLELSEEKTLITHSSKKARFLSYEFSIYKKGIIQKVKSRKEGILPYYKKTGIGQISMTMPKDIIIKKMKENRVVKDLSDKTWRGKAKTELIHNSDLEILTLYNAQIRGLYNYFSLTRNVSNQLNSLYGVMKWSFFHTLATKHKSTIAKQCRKLRIGHSNEYGIQYKNKKGETKTRTLYHQGFKRKKYNASDKSKDGMDNIPNPYKFIGGNELEKRMLANKCEFCGIEREDCQVHHINAMKNADKDKSRIHRKMVERNRKTMVLCPECHLKQRTGKL